MASVSDFQTRFPALASTAEATIQAHLDAAERLLSVSTWGTLLDDGILYLAAHLVAFNAQGAARSVSAGQASVSYGDPMTSLKATSYGAHFAWLCRLVGGSPLVVNS